jgi:iron complex outermembrane receptor protein
MPPMRLGGGAYWRSDEWFVRMGLLHAFAQTNPGLNETRTPGYNLLKLEISRKRYLRESPWGPTELTMGLAGDNLLDVNVRNSVMFHKDEILLPGRTVKLFINAKFNSEPYRSANGTYKAPSGNDPRPHGPAMFKAPADTLWTWSGFYMGGTAGYGLGRSNTATSYSDALTGTPLFAANNAARLNGTVIGAQTGYNWQFGRWVTGVETDVQLSMQATSPTTVCPGEICNPDPALGSFGVPVTASFQGSQKLEWFSTLRGRLGAAITPTMLLYATAGLAAGEVMTAGTILGTSATGDPINTIISQHTTRLGWTAGLGLEARLTGNWIGKIEYLHLDLGTIAVTPVTAPDATVAAAFNSRITADVVRLGANYRFDPAAVVAKF